jgi:hypothetical protein
MGKLLNAAIAGSKAAGPTYTYTIVGYAGGTISVYKNGSVIATPASDQGPISVSVVSGDTIRMTWTGSIGEALNILYYLNGVLQNTYTGSTSIDTGTKTLASSGAYNFTFNGLA